MCKYSLTERVKDAKKGDVLEICTARTSHVPPQTFGVFREKGGESGCVSCVKNDAVLTLLDIPADLQDQLKIGAREVVMMVDTDLHDEDMLFLHSTGQRVSLITFANKGIRAYVGELEIVESRGGEQVVIAPPARAECDII